MADEVNTPGTLRLRETEERMRRALGLSPGAGPTRQATADSPRQKRRFVADGEVPVTVISSARGRGGDDPERLEAERQARLHAERALHEAQGTIRDLQTKLAHAGIAAAEAQQTAAAERHRAEELAIALREAEERVRALEAPPEPKPKRARAAAPAGAKPVKWWLTGRRGAGKQGAT